MRGTARLALAVCVLVVLGTTAQAVSIDAVTVGDAGNQADARAGHAGRGAVAYEYRIATCEVTNAQYREFLTAKAAYGDPHSLYNSQMAGTYGGIARAGSGVGGDPYVYSAKGGDANWDDRPVVFVSFWDAARFCNWMHNGQGGGDTETGAYINVGNQSTFERQADALHYLPTVDEWYKAAYYKGGSLDAGYWEYATQSDTQPTTQPPPGTDLINGSANYYYHVTGYVDPVYYSTPVGAYTEMPSVSAYGTFDQSGNVAEWVETMGNVNTRILRDGTWKNSVGSLGASAGSYVVPTAEYEMAGFRLGGSVPEGVDAIPEPATVTLLGIAAGAALLRRRRRRA